MKLRLKSMWLNVIKVRYLALRLLGNDLSRRIWGIDEKPIHFNEGGSKGACTLEIAGAPLVRLKQNHADTRERVSLMTSVCSDPDVTRSFSNMPLEVMFKALSPARTKALRCEDDMKVAVVWAVKGSYRTDHILNYLRRWLEPWTPLRAETNDWRILMLDVARSHVGDKIVALCHERGYCCLYHFGCTTGVAQVNDTDLHAEYSQQYIHLETLSFFHQQVFDPGNIKRTPADVLADASAAWRSCDHTKGSQGHWFTGLSNALDGSEDWRITRDAALFWRECDMPAVRLKAQRDVDDMLASGEISSFADWQKVVENPLDPGVRGAEGDGTEFEGELEQDELPWLDDTERAAILRDDIGVLEDELRANPPVEKVVEQEVRMAVHAADRLAKLREFRATGVNLRVPAAVGLLDAEIKQTSRGLHAGGNAESQEAQATIRSLAEGIMHKELAAVHEKQLASAKRRREEGKRRQIVSAARAKAALAKEMRRHAKAEFAVKAKAVPIIFDRKAMSAKDKAGTKAREDCLDRLKLGSPALSFEHDYLWPDIRRKWCRLEKLKKLFSWNPTKREEYVGHRFIKVIDETLRSLGCHYKGETKYNKKEAKEGDPLGFQNLFLRMQGDVKPPKGSFVKF